MQELISKYDQNYPNLNHLRLAEIIKENEQITLEIRTLRRYISSYRNGEFDDIKNSTVPSFPGEEKLYEYIRNIFEKELSKHEDSKLWNSGEYNVEEEPQKEQPQNKRSFTTPGKYLVLGCVHAPFYNERFIGGVLNMLRQNSQDFTGLVLNGDYLDMNTLSAHDSGNMPIDGITLGWEYEQGNQLLDNFDEIFHNKDKVFIYGNHEDRYNRAILKPDYHKMTGELRSPAVALGLEKRGFNCFRNWKDDYITLGNDLEVIHGVYTNEHVAKKHVDVFQTNIMFAHCHRIQTYHGQNSGYAIGGGANFDHLVFDYANRGMKMPWNNGCAVVTVDDEGDHHVEVIKFKANKVFYNGKKYD
jgi:hypothetical protein